MNNPDLLWKDVSAGDERVQRDRVAAPGGKQNDRFVSAPYVTVIDAEPDAEVRRRMAV
ncbi:hypothetical protein [Nocardia africana]|uniref:hypothetical protein n=1 Tax=Nocardia africana TaxID=134964 RepID=UPI001D15E383|nr:hypothetical protein [Nocardia africana]MCC3311341.1 hypothetical protein [Nocardia africana]